METFKQDLAYGLRLLAKNKRFTAVAVLSLAIGIGATTAIFSVDQCAPAATVALPRRRLSSFFGTAAPD